MAARTNKIRHDEETRAKIQTSQLINRLTNHVLGKCDMAATQVTAALGLLRKSLPDLTATQHSGNLNVSHEDALEQLDRPPAGDTPEASGRSTALRGKLPENPDEGRLH
jgi:hypothetical protein